MTTAPTPGQPLPPPLLVLPATGLLARPVSEFAAEVVLYGGPQGVPLVQASIALTRPQLVDLAAQLAGLADTLTDAPRVERVEAGPQLVTPPSGLVVPGRG